MFNIDKLKLNILALIPLFLLFLPSFGFVVGNKGIVLYYVCLVIFFVIITFTNLKKYVKRILLLYKITPFKYVVYFVLWVLISGFINMLIGHYKFSVFIYYITSLILIDYCLTYLLTCFLYDNKKYNLKFLIKFLFIAYFFIFCFCLVEFIGKTFNISAIINIKLFLSNLREVNLDDIGQITRVSSVFQEPGWFGGFIFINMPIIYKICLSKYKLFENKFMNIIIKHSLVPLMLFNILVCQSAIWFVFCIILTIIFFKQKLKKIVYKYNLVFHNIPFAEKTYIEDCEYECVKEIVSNEVFAKYYHLLSFYHYLYLSVFF